MQSSRSLRLLATVSCGVALMTSSAFVWAGDQPVKAAGGKQDRAPSAANGPSGTATPPSQPWAFEKSDVPVDPALRFGTLANGVRYVIRHNATPRGQASAWVRIDAGSLMEKPDQLGLAHFMEHMAFNGTTEIPKNELIHKLQRLGLQFGADLNAGTTYDQTFYRLDLPSVDDAKLDTALHVLRQQVSAATMEPGAIEEERGVIQGEERLRNSPAVMVGLKQLGVIAQGTRIPERNPIGDMNVIRTAPRERFVDYYETYYRPSRATVIAVGDFDVDVMEGKIRKAFESWRPAAPDGPNPDLGVPTVKGSKTNIYVADGITPSLSMTWISPARNREDSLATRRQEWVAQLGLAVLQRRFLELSRSDNPPFATAGGSKDDLFRAIHLAGVNATYFPGKWKQALQALEQGKRQFEQYGVSQSELDREINSMRTLLRSAVKNAGTRDTRALAAEINKHVNDREVTTSPEKNLEIFEDAVQGITAAEVSEAAKTIFVGEGPIIALNSTKPIEGGDAALAAALEESRKVQVAAVQAPVLKPWAYTDFGPAGHVVSTEGPDVLGGTTVTFANGVKLTVKHTDFDKGSISVGLLTGIGERNFSPDKLDPRAAAVGNFIPGGLNKMTVDEVSRALNGHVVNAGLQTLGQRFLISGGTRPEDLQLEMQYLAAHITDAAFRSAAFDKVIATAPAGWMLVNSTPGGVFGVKAKPVMAGGDQRLAIAPPEVTSEWKMDPVRDDVRRMIGQGPIHVVMVGDVSLDEAVKATASTLGALPPRAPFNAPAPGADVRRFANPTPEPLVFTHNGLKEQALGVVAWPTTDVTGPRRLARQLSVMRSVLQLRVLDVIREQEALAYSPGVVEEYSPDYKGYGYVQINAATAPDKLPAFYAAVDRIVKDLQARPISADELKRARQPMVEHFRQAMDNNGWWFQQLLGAAYRPETLRDALDVEADYDSVTPGMIQQFAKQYLALDKSFKASIIPDEGAISN